MLSLDVIASELDMLGAFSIQVYCFENQVSFGVEWEFSRRTHVIFVSFKQLFRFQFNWTSDKILNKFQTIYIFRWNAGLIIIFTKIILPDAIYPNNIRAENHFTAAKIHTQLYIEFHERKAFVEICLQFLFFIILKLSFCSKSFTLWSTH